jgi:hypothetical protein
MTSQKGIAMKVQRRGFFAAFIAFLASLFGHGRASGDGLCSKCFLLAARHIDRNELFTIYPFEAWNRETVLRHSEDRKRMLEAAGWKVELLWEGGEKMDQTDGQPFFWKKLHDRS